MLVSVVELDLVSSALCPVS